MFPSEVLGEAETADFFDGMAFFDEMLHKTGAQIGARDGFVESDGAGRTLKALLKGAFVHMILAFRAFGPKQWAIERHKNVSPTPSVGFGAVASAQIDGESDRSDAVS